MSTDGNFDNLEALPSDDPSQLISNNLVGHCNRRDVGIIDGCNSSTQSFGADTYDVRSSAEHSSDRTPLTTATTKSRDDKLRQARDKAESRRLQRLAELEEAERHSQETRDRILADKNKRVEELKRKTEEKRKIVEERRRRMQDAEKERRDRLLRKMLDDRGQGDVSSSSGGGSSIPTIMTASCWLPSSGGNRHSSTRPLAIERPRASTGRLIGFGSSSPRMVCEPLSRPHSAGSGHSMSTSVHLPLNLVSPTPAGAIGMGRSGGGHHQKWGTRSDRDKGTVCSTPDLLRATIFSLSRPLSATNADQKRRLASSVANELPATASSAARRRKWMGGLFVPVASAVAVVFLL